LAIQARSFCCTSGVSLLRGPRGPAGGRSIFPVARSAIDTRLAQLKLTRNRAANCFKLPSPCWCASNSFRLKSSEYAFAICSQANRQSSFYYLRKWSNDRRRCGRTLQARRNILWTDPTRSTTVQESCNRTSGDRHPKSLHLEENVTPESRVPRFFAHLTPICTLAACPRTPYGFPSASMNSKWL